MTPTSQRSTTAPSTPSPEPGSAPLHVFSTVFELMVQHTTRGDWASFAQAYLDPIETLVVGPPKSKINGVVFCAIPAHKVVKELGAALKPI